MTRDETVTFLRARSGLTSQPYGNDTVDAWHEALTNRDYDDCRAALMAAAREHQRITLAHIVERLPRRHFEPPEPEPEPEPRATAESVARHMAEIRTLIANARWNHPSRRL